MFRLQNNIPSTYTEQSRDFQSICRLFDIINCGVRFDIRSMNNLLDPMRTNKRMLNLLAAREGFFTDKNMATRAYRYILSAFPYMIKNKGTQKAIEYLINAILRVENADQSGVVDIVNSDIIASSSYTIKIYLPITLSATSEEIFNEVLKYIVPTGYTTEVYYDVVSPGKATTALQSVTNGGILTGGLTNTNTFKSLSSIRENVEEVTYSNKTITIKSATKTIYLDNSSYQNNIVTITGGAIYSNKTIIIGTVYSNETVFLANGISTYTDKKVIMNNGTASYFNGIITINSPKIIYLDNASYSNGKIYIRNGLTTLENSLLNAIDTIEVVEAPTPTTVDSNIIEKTFGE